MLHITFDVAGITNDASAYAMSDRSNTVYELVKNGIINNVVVETKTNSYGSLVDGSYFSIVNESGERVSITANLRAEIAKDSDGKINLKNVDLHMPKSNLTNKYENAQFHISMPKFTHGQSDSDGTFFGPLLLNLYTGTNGLQIQPSFVPTGNKAFHFLISTPSGMHS
jgi:hypothetical protein